MCQCKSPRISTTEKTESVMVKNNARLNNNRPYDNPNLRLNIACAYFIMAALIFFYISDYFKTILELSLIICLYEVNSFVILI